MSHPDRSSWDVYFMRIAREVATRAVFLHQGAIEEDGPPAQVFGAPKSERCRQFIAAQL